MRHWLFLMLASSILFVFPKTVTSNFEEADLESRFQMAIYDVSLSKTTISGGPLKYGVSVPFQLVVTNEGDMPIANVQIIDNIPPGYTFDAANPNGWTPHPTIPSAYITTIAGPIDPNLTGTTTINLITQPSDGINNWINAAEVYAFQDDMNNQVEDQDPTTQDNSSTANVRIYDLALKKDLLTSPPYAYYDTLTFRNTIFNQGNETTGEVIIADYITEGYEYIAGINSPFGWVGSAPEPKAAFTGLVPGDSTFIDIKLVLLPNMFDAGAWNNTSEIFQISDAAGIPVNDKDADSVPRSNTNEEQSVEIGGPDDNNINGLGPAFNEDEDDHDPAGPRVLDLAIRKTRGTAVPSYSYTQNVEFVIEIHNQGNIALNQVVIVDTLTCGLDFDQGINPGWTYDASINSVRFIDNDPPLSSEDKVYSLALGVSPCYDSNSQDNWDNAVEIESVIASDGLGNEDIDGDFDALFTNDLFTEIYSADDNNLDGLGPLQGEDEDNHDVERADVYDLALKNEIITPLPYKPGDTLDFRIRVYNQGNIVADSIDFRSHIPPGYIYSQMLNDAAGWVMVDDSTLNILHNQYFYPSDSIDIILKLIITESDGPLDYVNRSYVYIPRDTFGLNRGDDADSFPFGENPGEILVLPGSALDNDLFADGPPDTDQDEDDHDPAGFFVADLALSKSISNPSSTYLYGQNVTFDIEVTNEGVQNVVDYKLVDYLPCGFEFSANNGWTLNNMTGFLEYFDNDGLIAGESETVQLILTIAECANPTVDSWNNEAEISEFTDESGGGNDFDSTPDENPDNNPDAEDDSDTSKVEIFDLSLSKNATSIPTQLKYGDPITFMIQVTNQGNVTADNIEVTDYLRCGYGFDSNTNPNWNLDNISGYLTYDVNQTLAPNMSVNIPLILTYQACNEPINPWYNKAEISNATDDDDDPREDSDSDPDDDPGNDPDGEDDNDDDTIDAFDLSLTKVVRLQQPYEIGEFVIYDIAVTNEGNINGTSIEIVDYLPCGLLFNQGGINSDWSMDLNGNLNYTIDEILVGETATISVELEVSECVGQPIDYRNVAEIKDDKGPNGEDVSDGDSNPDDNPNNDAPDEDDIASADIDVPMANAVIGDFVWEDLDGDGFQDNNEPGIDGVTVTLCDENNKVVATTTTLNNGFYQFIELEGGNYILKFQANTDLTPTIQDGSNNDDKDSDISGSNGLGTTEVFTLSNNEIKDDIDAGFFECVKICGTIWYDVNKNDIYDSFENGINGLKVNIYRLVSGSYTLWETTLTGHKPNTPSDDGYFEFCTNPGTYYVEVIMPPYGLVQVRANVGPPSTSSDLVNSFGKGTTNSFTVSSGSSNCGILGGYYPMATIGNLVWADINNNGIQDNTEQPISGVTIDLYDDTYSKIATTITNIEGKYEFDYLEKKSYYIEVVPPVGYTVTAANTGAFDEDSDINHENGFNTSSMFMMEPGVDAIHIDAGLANSVLPVEWLNITAEAFDDYNLIAWEVGDQINVSYYAIERMNNTSREFEQIGKSTSSIKSNYSFRDLDIANGTSIYRITQYDYDGQSSNSPTVELQRFAKQSIKLYPNPTIDQLQIQLPNDGTYVVMILDMVGHTIRQYELSEGLHRLDIKTLPVGKYNVITKSNGNTIDKQSIIKIN